MKWSGHRVSNFWSGHKSGREYRIGHKQGKGFRKRS